MSYIVIIRFEGVTETDYWAVNDKLGINRDGSGSWPKGLQYHAGGPTPDGWIVTERWESKAQQEAWMGTTLGPILAQVGIPAPVQVIDFEPANEKRF